MWTGGGGGGGGGSVITVCMCAYKKPRTVKGGLEGGQMDIVRPSHRKIMVCLICDAFRKLLKKWESTLCFLAEVVS